MRDQMTLQKSQFVNSARSISRFVWQSRIKFHQILPLAGLIRTIEVDVLYTEGGRMYLLVLLQKIDTDGLLVLITVLAFGKLANHAGFTHTPIADYNHLHLPCHIFQIFQHIVFLTPYNLQHYVQHYKEENSTRASTSKMTPYSYHNVIYVSIKSDIPPPCIFCVCEHS